MERLWNQSGGADGQARLTYTAHTDRRRYNISTGNEITIILPGENITADHREIIVQLKGGSLKRIHQGNHEYPPLHYVLLFPRGELGWHKDIILSHSIFHLSLSKVGILLMRMGRS